MILYNYIQHLSNNANVAFPTNSGLFLLNKKKFKKKNPIVDWEC